MMYHIFTPVYWQKILFLEILRADLLFDDAHGVDCFPKQVIWDMLRDIGYEGHISNGTPFLMYPRNEARSSRLQIQSQRTAEVQGTADFQGTAEPHGAADISKSPNDYTPTDASQTSGGDEGLLDLYALNREVRRLKKQTLSQGQTNSQAQGQTQNLSKWNKEEGTLSEEHYVQDDYTADPFFEDIVDKDAAVTPDLERKSDETEEINIEEKKASDVKSGDTEELDLEVVQKPEEQFKVDEVLADISRPRSLSIPGPIQSQPQPQQPSQATDPKDKGKGILVEEPKKKKLTLQQIRLWNLQMIRVSKKDQAEWDAEEERKRLEELKKAKPKTTSLAQERNQMMNFLKGQGYKNLQKLKYPQMKELYDKVQESIKDSFKDFIPMGSEKEREMLKERETKRLLRKRKATISEEQPSKKLKLRTETVDEIRNYLRIVIDSPDGQYLIIHRANNHFRAFDTLWEILHILDRQDLQHLYRVVQSYFEHIPPTGLGLILLGDLTTIWETPETSDDDFWKNQEDWEIIRWRLNESSGVHTLELEDGTMIHMLAERRYPLSRELMIRMLDHGMEVEDETDAEQRRPTIKKLEVKQVEFKLGEDCWEIQVKRTNVDETGRALGEATSCRDSCLIALQNKQNELEKYIAFDYRKRLIGHSSQSKLNETSRLLAR
ncbi:hypothetical protein Tco_0507433 [Tanacetum coccineum]